MHRENIEEMYSVVEADRGFDAVIVVSSERGQADFWQERLEVSRSSVIGRGTQIVSVEEDWPGGAGQLLGTLAAWQKAQATGRLAGVLEHGGTVAMYHTAGKGMRMWPLPAAESGNKSAIRLPRLVEVAGRQAASTVLEAVIFQTGIMAASRSGRLSVFWGDQVFIPATSVLSQGDSSAEILCVMAQVPQDEATWTKEWQCYGLILPGEGGEILQREKQGWNHVQNLIQRGLVAPDDSGRVVLGRSLGCFSMSSLLLTSLLAEFEGELARKQGKLDTDPHLWMPLTSERDEFVAGGGDAVLWDRLDRFRRNFLARAGVPSRLLVGKDLGDGTFWWDYGQLGLYHRTCLRLLEDSFEGSCLRRFHHVEDHWVKDSDSGGLAVRNSVLVGTRASGSIKDSVLFGVTADDIDMTGSVVVDSRVGGMQGSGVLVYNCIEPATVDLEPGTVLADVFLPSTGRVRMRTTLGADGKEDWERRVSGNYYAYAELERLLGGGTLPEVAAEKARWEAYHRERELLGDQLKGRVHGFVKPTADNLVEIVWGGDFIERLKGLPPSGRRIGESWECSTHRRHPSMVSLPSGLDLPLSDLLTLMGPEVLGRETAGQSRGNLPILVKFIDARQDLSVQVHPSDEKARELRESDSGKTEAWIVLHAEEGAVVYLGFNEDVDRAEFEEALSSPEINIAQRYLNAFPVKRGDVLLNPAGTVHAIGRGLVLAEIQQSSGITYRLWDWNRNPPRPMNRGKALEALDFRRTHRSDFERVPRRLSEHEERLVDTAYFTADRVTLGPGEEVSGETRGGCQVVTCLEGRVGLIGGDSSEELARGQSLLVPATLGNYRITASETAVLLKAFVMTPGYVDPVIFQTYDVRAIADEHIPDAVAFYLGKGYGTFMRRANDAPPGELWVVVGGGIRLSTERIRRLVVRGILSAGVNVHDVGTTSTPELYFAIPYLGADGGVNITASHNEADYNGLKQVIRSRDGFITSISAEQMIEVKRTILEGDFLWGEGRCVRVADGEVARYHNELVKANCRLGRDAWVCLLERWKKRGLKALIDAVAELEFPERLEQASWEQIRRALDLPTGFELPETATRHPLQGLKVVIDFGNGSAWRTKEIYTDLGADVVALNEEPDGSFPAHVPDPIKARYRRQLEEAVMRESAASSGQVVGIGHDEDADRVIFVRPDGLVVEGDRSLAIQARAVIEEHRRKGRPGRPRFMGEVKFSRVAEEFITREGGEYIMSPTGFAFIKEGIKTLTRALRAGSTEVELFGRRVDLGENREPVVLAAELSGHQMAGHEENWIFDDSSVAAAKLLAIVARASKVGKTLIDLDEEVPRYPASPELNIRLETNVLAEKQEVVDRVVDVFLERRYSIDTTDGGLIEWRDGAGHWLGQALVRKSNTQPMIICRVEGRDTGARQAIEDEFFHVLSRISTEAVPRLNLASDDYVRGILPRVLSRG